MKKRGKELYQLIASMVIFGTIGVFRRGIGLSSAAIAAARGIVGAVFLLLLQALKRRKLNGAKIRENLALLLASGVLIGVNWILLFEAYRFTTVAVATLCYYMAPVLVILVSPLILREKLTAKKLLCVLVAVGGMVLVSGVLDAGNGKTDLRGVLLGLGAAALYAAVVLINKRMPPMPSNERTIVQLLAAGVVLVPYVFATGALGGSAPSITTLALLAVVCIVHTGLAYALYFSSVEALPAHTLALLSYIDPVVAVLLSALVLRERLTLLTVIGAVLILGAAAFGELPERKKV